VPMVVGAAVREMFGVTRARFGPECDFTSIARVLEEWSGIRFEAKNVHLRHDTPRQ